MPVDGARGATAAGTFMATGNLAETEKECNPMIEQPHATDQGHSLLFLREALHPQAG